MVTSISTPRERGSGDFDGENCLQGRGVRFCGFRSLFKTSSKARKNLDTMQMIDIRLQRMPDAIEALYLHMLGNQERLYQQEAAVYIRLMVTSFPLDPSILHFIFIDNRQWSLGPLSSRWYVFRVWRVWQVVRKIWRFVFARVVQASLRSASFLWRGFQVLATWFLWIVETSRVNCEGEYHNSFEQCISSMEVPLTF